MDVESEHSPGRVAPQGPVSDCVHAWAADKGRYSTIKVRLSAYASSVQAVLATKTLLLHVQVLPNT